MDGETKTIPVAVYYALIDAANNFCREGLTMQRADQDTYDLVIRSAQVNRERLACGLSLDDAIYLLKIVRGVD